MSDLLNNYFQYNSCTSRGICSFNPRVSALQTVLVLYLRLSARYIEKLENTEEYENFILNTLAITIYNPDFNEESFLYALQIFHKILPEMMKKYSQDKDENIFNEENKKIEELFKSTSDIIKSIQYGEKVFNRAQKVISQHIRDLYSIMLVIAKSLSINLLELQSYDNDYRDAYKAVLKLLVNINLETDNIEVLKKEVYEAVKIDIKLQTLIREVQEECYGAQISSEVSFSTVPNKAVLVVGSNIRELELILDALKDEDIDIYTHDDMMLAYTFPKFLEYSRLKGQFGFGLQNCLLDFATFPGPIILTKNSLNNIENFYRGRLFTTDYMTSPKGIIKIENNDFLKLIGSAKSSKGFKRGKQCESITIGFDYEKVKEKITSKIEFNKYNQIFLIGFDNYSLEQKAYFEKLIKSVPEDILIISFSYNFDKENLIYVNSCYDYYSIVRIFNLLKDLEIKINVFLPKCERHTIPQMIYFSNNKNTKIYLGKCTPIILNPSLIKTFQEEFGIMPITTAKKDLENII